MRTPAYILAALCSLTVSAAAADTIVGPAIFKDADSPFVNGQELRLANGIDAPELVQPCTKDGRPWFAGQVAAIAVNDMFAGKTIVCTTTGGKSYKRPLVTCQVDGVDVAAAIVRYGWAFDYPKYSNGEHQQDEQAARSKGLGIWAGACETPWTWRRKNW